MRGGRLAGAGAIVAAMALTGTAGAAAKKPDLTVAKLAVSRASVPAGSAVTLTAKVRNKGTKKAPASKLAVFLSSDARKSKSDAKLGTKKLRAVKPRKTGKGKLTVTLPTAGAWKLIACADAAGKIKERSEKNNCRAVAVEVTSVAPPPGAPGPVPAPAPVITPSPTPNPTPAANPLKVGASTLDTARATTQRIGSGTLIATGADGTKYTLTIPSGALPSAQDITMTPVTAVAGNPLGGLVGAVKLEPEGLQLLKAATLTIEPPGGVPADASGFQFHAGGNDFHLYPLEHADKLTLGLTHFSTPGVAHANEAERNAVLSHTPARKDAQFEQAIAQIQSNPSALATFFDQHYDTVVKPALEAAGKSDGSDAEQAIMTGLEWARQVAVLGGDGGARETEMWQLIEIAIRNAVDKGFHACHDDHDLTQIIRLMQLQRFALLLGLDIGDAFGKALACAHFEVNFDGRFTETESAPAPDNGHYDLNATWDMKTDRLPIDISGQGSAPLVWNQFAYHSVETLPGSSCTLTTTVDGTTTKNTTVSALLEMDLAPRETPPAGQPKPQPRVSYLRLQPSPGTFDTESYHSQNSGCSSGSTDYTDFNWFGELADFHTAPGEAGSAVRIKLNPATQTGDLLDAEHIDRTRVLGNEHHGESTFIEIFHTPQAAP